MGLLAIVAAQARRYDVVPAVVRLLPLLSALLVAAGLGVLAVLPLDGQFRSTYFSENALLAHQAITFFRESEWDVVRGYKGWVTELAGQTEAQRMESLSDVFSGLGLANYVQPLKGASVALTEECDASEGDTATSANFYAIQRASRGPHNEAIVIAAPWLAQDGRLNEGGVALLASLARFFQRWNFLHKNLIFVVSADSGPSLREWVAAYHSTLQHTAGSIEGAVVLDYAFPAEFFDHVDVCYDGLNGQLPNLDLVNTAVHSVLAEFARVSALDLEGTPTYQLRAASMLRHLWRQVWAGLPSRAATADGSSDSSSAGMVTSGTSCGSAMFSGWRIDAVTLRAVEGGGHHDITTLGRVCESTVRALNNLLEHFHQSFFFYILLGPTHFVSIASFLPAAMCVAASFSVMALSRLSTIGSSESTKGSTSKTSDANSKGTEPVTNTVSAASTASSSQKGSSGTGTAAAGLLALLLVAASGLLVSSGRAALVFLGLAGTAATLLGVRLDAAQKTRLSALALGLVGLELTTLAMVNFGLAMGLGLAMAPLAWVRPGRASCWVGNVLLATLASPPALLAALAQHSGSGLVALLDGLVWSGSALGTYTWLVVCVVWTPCWLAAVASI